MMIHVNNVSLYYEKSGTGRPLLMLHANGHTHKGFHKAIPILAQHFTVYAIDSRGHGQSDAVINQFVYMVTPTSDTVFCWYINLSGTADVKATFTAEGRKNRAVIQLEEIEKISSLHRKENEDDAQFIKNPLIFTLLHRQR